MMLLLPLQWSWAAAASVCGHESGNAHFGHHEHQHVDGQQAGDGAADDLATEPPGEHPDCQACHGVGAACIERADRRLAAWRSSTLLPDHGRALPEPPVESLLRPPLIALVA